MTGNALIKELLISKADLVRACLSIGLPVFGVDVLQREFSPDEINIIQKSVSSVLPVNQAKSGKSKKKPANKVKKQKTLSFYADDFQTSIEDVFAIANSFGFNVANENRVLTQRQCAVLEEQLIARENPAVVELQNESVEISGNTGFALALKQALHLKRSSPNDKLKTSKSVVEYVATARRLKLVANEKGIAEELLEKLCAVAGIPVESAKKSLKIDVQYLDQVDNVVDVFNVVQQFKSSEEKVRISKIAKTFGVQAKDVRELCEANGIPVISERFIANDSEINILVLLQLKSVQGDEILQITPDSVTEKKISIKTSSVDYSGLSLTRQEVHDYDFSRSIMREIDFSYSKLSDLSFNGSQLQDSTFVQVSIKNSIFEYANLAGAAFEFVVAENVDFKNTNLDKASFRKAKLKNCSFAGSDLSQSNFQDAELENCDFSGAVIADTKWIDGKLVQSCEDLANYGTK